MKRLLFIIVIALLSCTPDKPKIIYHKANCDSVVTVWNTRVNQLYHIIDSLKNNPDTVYAYKYELLTISGDTVIATYRHIDSLGKTKFINYYNTVGEWLTAINKLK